MLSARWRRVFAHDRAVEKRRPSGRGAAGVPRKLLVRASELFSERAGALRPGELSCRKGCFGCCVGLFALPVPEALAVRDAWRSLPEAEKAEIARRAERAVAQSGSLFPGDAEAGLLDPGRDDAAEDRYFESVADVVCPLLELPSGRCRVYDARPVTCRTYGLPVKAGGALSEPACPLNFVGAPPGRSVEAAIDARNLLALDQTIAEEATAAGLPGGAETTLAHVLAGRTFPWRGGPPEVSRPFRPSAEGRPPRPGPAGAPLPPRPVRACGFPRRSGRRRAPRPAPSRG